MSQHKLPPNYGIIRQDASIAALQPMPIPHLADEYVIVRTEAVAINPTDWTTLDAPGASGTLQGCDFAGTIIKIGKTVSKKLEVGDRVIGFAHGANDLKPWTGAFARFVTVKGDLVVKIPNTVSWEEACTACVALATAGWGLWGELNLVQPQLAQHDIRTKPNDTSGTWVLIYGGSTATGTIAIQLAKLSGYKVVTTASPKHFEMLRIRGADLILDYRAPDIGKQIRERTNGSLRHVFDCVAIEPTAAICADVFGPAAGVYCSLLPVVCPRDDIESKFFLTYSLTGEDYIFESQRFEVQPHMFSTTKAFLPLLEEWWKEGKWMVHPQQVRSGGLGGIHEGFEEMKAGKVSGFKLVYRIEDTVWPEA